MKIYTVYLPTNALNPLEEAILVKEGFNFMAAIFGFFWLISKKMWWPASVCLVINAAISYGINDENIAALWQVIFNLILGLYANDLYGYYLSRNKYYLSNIVSGKNFDEAQDRLFSYYPLETNTI